MASPAKANGSERLSFDMEDSGSGVRAALVAGREEEEETTTYASLLHGNRASQAAESGLRTSPSWGVTLNAITYMVSPHHTPPRARARHTDRHTERERERERELCVRGERSKRRHEASASATPSTDSALPSFLGLPCPFAPLL